MCVREESSRLLPAGCGPGWQRPGSGGVEGCVLALRKGLLFTPVSSSCLCPHQAWCSPALSLFWRIITQSSANEEKPLSMRSGEGSGGSNPFINRFASNSAVYSRTFTPTSGGPRCYQFLCPLWVLQYESGVSVFPTTGLKFSFFGSYALVIIIHLLFNIQHFVAIIFCLVFFDSVSFPLRKGVDGSVCVQLPS